MKSFNRQSGTRHSKIGKRNCSAVLRAAVEALEGRTLLSSVVVNSASDTATGAGVVTLRDAISMANSSTTPTTITFSASVFAKAQTITLDGTTLEISGTEPVTIEGPAAGVTIDANQKSGDLQVDNGATMSLTGMKITGGSLNGITDTGTATLTGCTLSGNQNAIQNGELGFPPFEGALTLTNCTVSNNSLTGIENVFGTASLTDCTVSGNSFGGISNMDILTLTGCTVSGNSVHGIQNYYDTTVTDCTITGNAGGGIVNANGTTTSPGGVASGFPIANSIVAGNTGPDATGPFNSLGFNLVGFGAGCHLRLPRV